MPFAHSTQVLRASCVHVSHALRGRGAAPTAPRCFAPVSAGPRCGGRRDRLGLDSEPLIPPPPRSRPGTVPPSPALLLPVQLEDDAPLRPDRPSHRGIALHLSVDADHAGAAGRAPSPPPVT